jgi:hypothetical protein
MAQQFIDIGGQANDGTGDSIRDAFDKANSNFSELYSQLGGITISTGTSTTSLDTATINTILTEYSGVTATLAVFQTSLNNNAQRLDTFSQNLTSLTNNLSNNYVPTSGGTFTGAVSVLQNLTIGDPNSNATSGAFGLTVTNKGTGANTVAESAYVSDTSRLITGATAASNSAFPSIGLVSSDSPNGLLIRENQNANIQFKINGATTSSVLTLTPAYTAISTFGTTGAAIVNGDTMLNGAVGIAQNVSIGDPNSNATSGAFGLTVTNKGTGGTTVAEAAYVSDTSRLITGATAASNSSFPSIGLVSSDSPNGLLIRENQNSSIQFKINGGTTSSVLTLNPAYTAISTFGTTGAMIVNGDTTLNGAVGISQNVSVGDPNSNATNIPFGLTVTNKGTGSTTAAETAYITDTSILTTGATADSHSLIPSTGLVDSNAPNGLLLRSNTAAGISLVVTGLYSSVNVYQRSTSASTGTGTVVVTGGLSVTDNLYVQNTINFSDGTSQSSAPPVPKFGAGSISAGGSFTAYTGPNGYCLIQIHTHVHANYGDFGTGTVSMAIDGRAFGYTGSVGYNTVASQEARTIEYDSRTSGDSPTVTYLYMGTPNSSFAVVYNYTGPGTATNAYFSYIGT